MKDRLSEIIVSLRERAGNSAFHWKTLVWGFAFLGVIVAAFGAFVFYGVRQGNLVVSSSEKPIQTPTIKKDVLAKTLAEFGKRGEFSALRVPPDPSI